MADFLAKLLVAALLSAVLLVAFLVMLVVHIGAAVVGHRTR